MKRIVVLPATVAALVLAAAPAHADQYDYVSALDSRGVYYESISDVIDLGKMMCGRLRNGVSPQFAPMPALNSGYSKPDAAIMLIAAIDNMCPDQYPVLNAYINGQTPQAAPEPPTAHPCTTANPPAGCADGSY